MKIWLITLLLIGKCFSVFSQDSTVGLRAGLTIFDIHTNNLTTVPGNSFSGGLVTRGDFYNNWDIQFGLNLFKNKLGVRADSDLQNDVIDYNLFGADIRLLAGYKLIGNNRYRRGNFKLTLEIGPNLMVNGKMKLLDESRNEDLLFESDLTAEQAQDISRMNLNVMGGLTIGHKNIRAYAYYTKGINNILSNYKNIEGFNNQSFSGFTAIIELGIVAYL